MVISENKVKQLEANLIEKSDELIKKTKELRFQSETLNNQKELLERKNAEIDKIKKQQIERLESISGMSAKQAKENLISSLKEEAEGEALSYINEIMEEARMTANTEAKKVIMQRDRKSVV